MSLLAEAKERSAPFDIQHVNIKIFARKPAPSNLAGAIPVFHRWIQNSVCPELLVDVADYRHVPAGPGVVLIGHEANYSLDCAFNRLGLLYNRKEVLDGSFVDKMVQAYGAAATACRRLEEEPEFSGSLSFDAGDFEIVVNDRLLAPNTEETWTRLEPDVNRFVAVLSGGADYAIRRLGGPLERFRAGVTLTARPA